MKMRRCEDEKMRDRPPLLEEPCTQTLSGMKTCTPLIWKSKRHKHHRFGALLEVGMLRKCTSSWRAAHFEVNNMLKTPDARTIFGSCDVEKVNTVVV